MKNFKKIDAVDIKIYAVLIGGFIFSTAITVCSWAYLFSIG